MVCDRTFTTSKFRQTLLFALSLDGNNQIILLAWALVQSENKQNWRFFLGHLSNAIGSMVTDPLTILSDREKALINATDSLSPNAYWGFCCQHIADSVRSRFGIVAQDLFWKVAKARSSVAYDDALAELREASSRAADYVGTITPELFATSHFPGPRFGSLTSNIVELMNTLYVEEHQLPPVDMMCAIWHKEMNRRYNTLQSARSRSEQHALTPWGSELLVKSTRLAGGFQIDVSSNT